MASLPYLKCSLPSCFNTVGQHDKARNRNKQVCSAHRKKKKNEVDRWKINQGCGNKDSHYGFPCVSQVILDPAQLDINHIDGNNNNRDAKNVEVLCKMCHIMVTLRNEHHLQPKESRKAKIEPTGLFDFS